ncbi:hypothetical protein C7999DRAFT_32322 [Corynascus novoguineensis]|uniref:Uncharacterized protein n=1 Tax=Corynascus novoguineensis TaxID=1126955 RepID=A0AAN7CS01_9PEZI|nr:hypothetical protein C7999DRAFT_32322 [Corynascus novoguineensis]
MAPIAPVRIQFPTPFDINSNPFSAPPSAPQSGGTTNAHPADEPHHPPASPRPQQPTPSSDLKYDSTPTVDNSGSMHPPPPLLPPESRATSRGFPVLHKGNLLPCNDGIQLVPEREWRRWLGTNGLAEKTEELAKESRAFRCQGLNGQRRWAQREVLFRLCAVLVLAGAAVCGMVWWVSAVLRLARRDA